MSEHDPDSDAGWRSVLRWVVVDPTGRNVLLLDTAGVPALPTTGQHGELWAGGPPGPILAALRTGTGLDAEVPVDLLRWLDADRDPDTKVLRVTLLASPRRPVPAPPGARWATRVDLDHPAAADLAEAAGVLDQLAGGRVPAGWSPWMLPGWVGETETWLHESLRSAGATATGPLELDRAWELSCVLKASTSVGTVYVKATAASPLFVDEGPVTSLLAELFPGQVPAPIAVDPPGRRLALADFGTPIGWRAPTEVAVAVMRDFARIQVAAIPHAGRLLDAGCTDRRLDRLASEAARWLPTLAPDVPPPFDQASWLSAAETAELGAAVPRLVALCERLAGYAIPPTLAHGDLHPGNVAPRPDGGYLFFDWTDACVAHPFVDLAVPLHERTDLDLDRVRDAYLAEWEGFESPARLAEAWRLAAPLTALHHAISYRSIVEHLVPPIDAHMAGSTANWLRRLLLWLPPALAVEGKDDGRSDGAHAATTAPR